MILCTMRVKNEERFLPRTLESLSRLADEILILDDGSTDGTREVCSSFDKVTRYEYQNLPVNEGRDKNRMLEWVKERRPEWALNMDADEVLTRQSIAVIQDEIANCRPDVTGFGFFFVFFWDNARQFRADGEFLPNYHVRMFSPARLDVSRYRFQGIGTGNLHGGAAPPTVRAKPLNVIVKHYGYIDYELRQEKYAFYTTHDRETNYDHIFPEWGAPVPLKPWADGLTMDCVIGKRRPERDGDRRWLAGRDHLLRFYRGGILLDIGCGASSCHPYATRIDGDPACEPDYVIPGDVLPFPDGSVDYVASIDNLEHYDDPVAALREWVRVLKPGGYVGFLTPDRRFVPKTPELNANPRHKHWWDPAELFERVVTRVHGLTRIAGNELQNNWWIDAIFQKR